MGNFQIPMLLGKVESSVIATMKDAHVAGRKLLLVRPQYADDRNPTRLRTGGDTFVAVDSVGAGVGEMVVICQGGSARRAPDLKEAPVDAVVMGIVDAVWTCWANKFIAARQHRRRPKPMVGRRDGPTPYAPTRNEIQ